MEISEFRNCLLSADLFDLSFRENLYTWWNNQVVNPIAKKLDRVMVNGNWLIFLPLMLILVIWMSLIIDLVA